MYGITIIYLTILFINYFLLSIHFKFNVNIYNYLNYYCGDEESIDLFNYRFMLY